GSASSVGPSHLIWPSSMTIAMPSCSWADVPSARARSRITKRAGTPPIVCGVEVFDVHHAGCTSPTSNTRSPPRRVFDSRSPRDSRTAPNDWARATERVSTDRKEVRYAYHRRGHGHQRDCAYRLRCPRRPGAGHREQDFRLDAGRPRPGSFLSPAPRTCSFTVCVATCWKCSPSSTADVGCHPQVIRSRASNDDARTDAPGTLPTVQTRQSST